MIIILLFCSLREKIKKGISFHHHLDNDLMCFKNIIKASFHFTEQNHNNFHFFVCF